MPTTEPPLDPKVEEIYVPESPESSEIATVLIREQIDRAPSGYLVAIDAVSGLRLDSFYVAVGGEVTYSTALGDVRLTDLPGGEQAVVGASGYRDEQLTLDAIDSSARHAVALHPFAIQVQVVGTDGVSPDDYVLWAWSPTEPSPSLRKKARHDIRSGMFLYATRGADASDVVQARSQGRITLVLLPGHAASFQVHYLTMAHASPGSDTHPVRVQFPSMVDSRWLVVATDQVELPRIDTRIGVRPGSFRINHSKTRESCPGWRTDGHVHTGRVDGNQMPRTWSLAVDHVTLPRVQVVDEHQRPLPGVSVRTYFDIRNRAEWRESSYGGMGIPETDKDGVANWTGGWLLSEIVNQGVRIEVGKPGFLSAMIDNPVQAWGDGLGRIVLRECSNTRVRILHSDGKPLRSEVVRFSGDSPSDFLADLQTDNDGVVDVPLAPGALFGVACHASASRGQIGGEMTEISLSPPTEAVIQLPSGKEADVVLVSDTGLVVERSARRDDEVVFRGLASTNTYTVVPRDALDQYRLCRFDWVPDIPAGVTASRLSSRPSWLDTPSSRAYVVAPDVPSEDILVIPWYGPYGVPLPSGHIPGKRLSVGPDYSVDLTGLHGQPLQLIAVLREPPSSSDWLLGHSSDCLTVECSVREIILAPSQAWLGGTAWLLGDQQIRWGAVCATGGVKLAASETRVRNVPDLVKRILWRK